MPTTQVRTVAATSGSLNDRLEDVLLAVNDVLGLAGDEWNDTTEGVANRWNQGVAFSDRLSALNGKNLREIIHAIDVMPLNNITQGAPGQASDNRLILLGNNNLQFGELADLTFTGTTGSTFTLLSPDIKLCNPTSGLAGGIRVMDGDDSHGFEFRAAPVMTGDFDVIMPTEGPSSNGQIWTINTDGSSQFVDLVQTGKYRGVLTLAGGSNNLPDINDGTVAIGQAFAVGDYWIIAADGTLDDGSNTLAVTEGQFLYVDDVTADEVSDFTAWGTASASDTNLFTGNQTNSFGNVTHQGGGYNFILENMGTWDIQADAFGNSVDAGSALAIDSFRTLTVAGYTAGQQEGTPNRTLGVDSTGQVVTFDVPKTGRSVRVIRFNADFEVGDILDPADASASGQSQMLLLPGDVNDLTAYNQTLLWFDWNVQFWLDGVRLDKSGLTSAALAVVLETGGAISFTQPIPADSILTIEIES